MIKALGRGKVLLIAFGGLEIYLRDIVRAFLNLLDDGKDIILLMDDSWAVEKFCINKEFFFVTVYF